MFFSKTLYSDSASLHPGIWMVPENSMSEIYVSHYLSMMDYRNWRQEWAWCATMLKCRLYLSSLSTSVTKTKKFLTKCNLFVPLSYLQVVCIHVEVFMKLRKNCLLLSQCWGDCTMESTFIYFIINIVIILLLLINFCKQLSLSLYYIIYTCCKTDGQDGLLKS